MVFLLEFFKNILYDIIYTVSWILILLLFILFFLSVYYKVYPDAKKKRQNPLYKKYIKKQIYYNNTNPYSIPTTIRWLNTAGALLLIQNMGNFYYVAGIEGKNEIPGIQKMLLDYWDITDKNSAINTMKSVLETGMRAKYRRNMEITEIYIEQMRERNPKYTVNSYRKEMLVAYEKYGENALLGWDMGRIAYIIQCCYVCGYISMEDMMDIGVDAGLKLQSAFNSWEEVMESYLFGLKFWLKDNKCQTVKQRKQLYKQIRKGKKVFSAISFHTQLSKTIPNEEELMLQN